jgi:hypothetical protein
VVLSVARVVAPATFAAFLPPRPSVHPWWNDSIWEWPLLAVRGSRQHTNDGQSVSRQV